MAEIALIASVVGGLASAGGAIVGGMASQSAAKYQNQVAQMNAKIAEENAARAIERSQIEQQDQDMITRSELGTQEALQAASGLSIDGGSQMLTRKTAIMLGRRDALNVRQAGELEKYSYLTQAANQRAEGEAALAKGKSAMVGSYLSAAGSLASTAASYNKSTGFFNRKS